VTVTGTIKPEYWGREQSLIKHAILKMYLQPAARIIGMSQWKTFTFVDCCSGPWELATEDYSDSSFCTAVRELRSAREFLHGRGINDAEMRCLFLEKKPVPFAKLERFCGSITDMEVKPLQGDFTEKISEILTFIREGKKPFTFFFIGPTGWKPVVLLNKIAPLLSCPSSEVLINFMTPFIKRFSGPQRIAENIGAD
jgi:three-Cys-motif partner protein